MHQNEFFENSPSIFNTTDEPTTPLLRAEQNESGPGNGNMAAGPSNRNGGEDEYVDELTALPVEKKKKKFSAKGMLSRANTVRSTVSKRAAKLWKKVVV